MKVEQTSCNGWSEAYRCTSGPVELIVVTSMGPRVVSLRLEDGANVLYEDQTGFSLGQWRLVGGHRFTVAPESAASYAPDNRPCEVRIARARLFIHQYLQDGLLRGLQISPCPRGLGFTLRHVLRNCGAQPWQGAPWSITCVPATGCVVVPKPRGLARFWDPPGLSYADAASGQWQLLGDHCRIEPQGRKGKIGLLGELGWLAWLGRDCSLVIRGPSWNRRATYPDAGCNIEVYTCAQYMELETLGPLTTLLPGQELVHVERWQLVPRAFEASGWRRLDRSLRPSRSRRRPAAITP